MPTITVTNTSSSAVYLRDLYVQVEAAGVVTVFRSQADLDRMQNLNDLVAAGTITVTSTAIANECSVSFTRVATLAALVALPNPGAPVLVQVASNLSYYMFEVTGTNGLAPLTGTGRWVRMFWGNPIWRAQADWYVDSVSGNDENSGAVGFPIKTIKELAFRLGGLLTRSTNVFLLNDPGGGDPLSQLNLVQMRDTASGGSYPGLRIVGQMTTTRTSTLFSAGVPAANVASGARDLTVADWTPDIAKMIVMTSGANSGAFAWILKDIGSNTARVSRWFKADYSANSGAPGTDTYKVVTLTNVTLASLASLVGSGSTGSAFGNNAQPGGVTYENINFLTSVITPREIGGFVEFRGCKFGNFNSTNRYITLTGCLITGTDTDDESISYEKATACACLGAVNVRVGGSAQLIDFIVQGGTVNIENGAIVEATGMCIYDSTGTALTVQNAKLSVITFLFGSGNLVGTDVKLAGSLRVVAGFTPLLTGTTELRVEGAATAIPPLTAGASTPAASALTTWANWAASPFTKFVFNYSTGSQIFSG